MGIKLGDAFVALRADKGQLDRDLDESRKSTESWSGRIADGIGIALGGAIVGAAQKGIAAIGQVGAAVFELSSGTATASNDLQAALGLTQDEAEHLGEIARGVWKNNFGEDIGDAAAAVGLVRQTLGEMSDQELATATENALRLRDAFDIGEDESISAVKTLMDQFGISSEKAFDLLAAGSQQGLNRTGDLVDSIEEYAVQFAEGGASAEEFFNVMEGGLAGGMLGTDKAADLFKEFRVRIQDGSATTSDALEQIGIDADELAEAFAIGGVTAIEAFGQVQNALINTEDDSARFQAGVALMGTQFEDMGEEAALGIDAMGSSFMDVEGAAGSLDAQYGDLGTTIEGWKRRAIDALTPFTDKMLEIVDDLMPLVNEAFATFEELVVPIIEAVAEVFGDFVDALFSGQDPVTAIQELIVGLMETFGASEEDIAAVIEWFQGFVDVVKDISERVGAFVNEHSEGLKAALIAIGAILAGAAIVSGIMAVVGAIGLLLNPIGLVVAAIALLAVAWTEDWGGIRTKLTEFWENTGKPIFEKFKEWLAVFIPQAIATLKKVWEETLLPAMEKVWAFIQEDLVPLLETLWELLEVAGGLALEALAAIWENVLQPALEDLREIIEERLMPAWDSFMELMGKVGESMGGVSGAFQTVVDWIGRIIDKLKDVSLPDWMLGQSPSPWEISLLGVSAALRELNQVQLPQLQAHLSGERSAAPGAAGGQTIYNTLNLTTSAPYEPIVQDYAMLQAMAGSQP